MGEPKAFASLSSGLLARKGAARPAMRPQGFAQLGSTLEDLGWNDMGFEPPKPVLAAVRDDDHDAFGEVVPEPAIRHPLAGLTPSGPSAVAAAPVAQTSPVHDQQAELADRFADYTVEPGEEDEEDSTAEPMDFASVAPVLTTKPLARIAPSPVPTVRHVGTTTVRAQPGGKAKSAFTLRLDRARHLKLRLACAVTGRSAQMLVTDALDQLLAAMPELEAMADNAPATRKAS
ncbi:MAG: hypothetical protein ABIO85_08100 [Sphingomicrobium sp.]